ncbi:MAG: hypothetical protein AAF845_05215 [Bacteroidota bacterium]
MQEMIAQVAATVIASLLLLSVGAIAWRVQHHSVDAVQYSAAKSEGLGALGRTLEEDLANLGAGLRTDRLNTAGAFVTYDSTRGDYDFTTWVERDARGDDVTTNDGALVRYDVRELDDADVRVRHEATRQFTSAPTFQVTRTSGGVSAVYDGILEAKIRLFDVDGQPTTVTTQACEVEVEVRQVSPLGGGAAGMVDGDAGVAPTVDQTRWTRRLRPANLARASACRR